MDRIQKKKGRKEVYYKPRYFKPSEVAGLNPKLIIILDHMRHDCGFPFKIASGLRPGDKGAHGTGDAVDLRLWKNRSPGNQRWKLANAALKYGITRMGFYDKHSHFDVALYLPQNVIWIGESR